MYKILPEMGSKETWGHNGMLTSPQDHQVAGVALPRQTLCKAYLTSLHAIWHEVVQSCSP